MKILPLVLPLLLAGCFADPQAKHDDRLTWGLGLELPAELPPAGPYLEPADQVARLENFIRNEAVHFGTCKDRPSENVQERLAAYDLIGTLEQIQRLCGIDGWDEQNASREVNETRAAIERREPPGTIVDAELLAYLRAGVRVVESMRDVGSYDMAGGEASMIRAIADGYPWNEGTCVYPDYPALVNETRAKYAAILESANQSASERVRREREWIERRIPGFERSVAEGRWWSVIHVRDHLDWEAAFVENLTVKRLPTFNETQFLLAQHRATQHTLGWEWSYIDVSGVMENWRVAWDDDNPYPAAKMYSMLAHGWRFGALHCS